MTGIVDDNYIETRFIWGRCSAKDAREIRSLIKAFQSDSWPEGQISATHKRDNKRGTHR